MTTSKQSTATNLVEVVFQQDLTKQGLADLRKKYPKSFTLNMKDDGDFKEARKIRTERNKLTKAINDRRISFTSELKGHGDDLISKVNEIYDPIVIAFEEEDKHRKEEAARIKAEHDAMLEKQRLEIADIKGFIQQCKGKDSQYIADALESVDLIETDVFHKDVIHEAIDTKKEVIDTLNEMYQTAKANEKVEAEREELRAQQAQLEKERTIENRINNLRNNPMEYLGKPSQMIQDRITQLENYTPSANDFGPRLDEVIQLQAQVIQQLRMMLTQAKLVEAAQVQTQAEHAPQETTHEAAPTYENEPVSDTQTTATHTELNVNTPLLGSTIHSDVFESSQEITGYQPLQVWPSDQERAESDVLDSVCDQLEVAESHILFLEAELNKALAA